MRYQAINRFFFRTSLAFQQIKTTFLSNNFSHSQASHPHEWENRLCYWCMFIFSYSWWSHQFVRGRKHTREHFCSSLSRISLWERESITWTLLLLTFPYIFVYYFLTVYTLVPYTASFFSVFQTLSSLNFVFISFNLFPSSLFIFLVFRSSLPLFKPKLSSITIYHY